jgi:hypothetical protein
MPTSQHFQISKIVNLIVHLAPASVLDIGPGFGKYGFLCREYLDCWTDRGQGYGKFSTRIDAIEVFEKYLTPVHRFIYNRVYIGNALDLLPTLETDYDLTLMIDVLEHFEKDEGKRLLMSALAKTKSLLVSVPRDLGSQGALFGNEHEAHRAEWTAQDLLSLAPGYQIRDNVSQIVFMGAQQQVNSLKWIMDPPFLVRMKRAIQGI